MAHAVTCTGPVVFEKIHIDQTAQKTSVCTITEGNIGEQIKVTAVNTGAPFVANLLPPAAALGNGATFEVSVNYDPEVAGDKQQAIVSIEYETIGQRLTASFEVEGSAWDYDDWDPVPEAPPCRVEMDAPLFEQALMQVGLTKADFGFTAMDLSESQYEGAGILNDEFVLSWFKDFRAQPAKSGCFEGEIAGALDKYLQLPHPVAGMIRHTATYLDRGPDDERPFDARRLPGTSADAINAICEAFGSACFGAMGEIPADLGEAIAPLLWAMHEGITVRLSIDAEAAPLDPDWWTEDGGNNLIISNRSGPDFSDSMQRPYLLGQSRAKLYRAASQIAYAVEHIDWAPFVGRTGVQFDQRTPAGWIRIRDGSDDEYNEDGSATLLLIDLGGNDIHYDDVASNRDGNNAVSLAIDLDGQDRYEYQTQTTPFDREGLLPADDGGRYRGDSNSNLGNVSLSSHFRQGAARNGIAMLFDYGEKDDQYQSLIGSQGYAHLGVGILFDDGGQDTYRAESSAQGSAQYGIGMLIDKGDGWDIHESFSYSQGFGFAASAGVLLDGGGDDTYVCNHGDPTNGGIRLYPSAQLPENGNSSFCQGAGFGRRGQTNMVTDYMSGGFGILRDIDGNDQYEASVFAQGTGYWQGTGLLSDGGGSDVYDAYWYVQGAAAHYAIGILADSGNGNDTFNARLETRNVSLGSGHDFSVGVLINEAGDNEYNIGTLAAGASNCNGVGLFVDNKGNDTYKARSDYSSGLGNVSGECIDSRPNAVNIGVMIDGGGTDTYEYPMSEYPVPANNATWGYKRNDLNSEYGAGLDAEGETGVHAESMQP